MVEKIFVAVHPVRTVMRSRRSRRLFTASRKAAGRLLFVLCKFTLNLFAHLVCLIKKKVGSLENSSYLLSASLSQSGHGQSVKTLPGNTDWLTSPFVFFFKFSSISVPYFFDAGLCQYLTEKQHFIPPSYHIKAHERIFRPYRKRNPNIAASVSF